MKLSQLKKLIESEVRATLVETTSTNGKPSSLHEFRNMLAEALSTAGAPDDLVEEVADVEYEGSGVASVIAENWYLIEGEEDWTMCSDIVHDCVIDIVSEFTNTMNYEPSPRMKKVNAADLAKKTVDVMFGKPSASDPHDMSDMVNLVSDVLDMCGCVSNVKKVGQKFTYDVTRSDYLELIDKESKKAGFTKVRGTPGTYVDDITGLKVNFGAGEASITR